MVITGQVYHLCWDLQLIALLQFYVDRDTIAGKSSKHPQSILDVCQGLIQIARILLATSVQIGIFLVHMINVDHVLPGIPQDLRWNSILELRRGLGDEGGEPLCQGILCDQRWIGVNILHDGVVQIRRAGSP